MWLSRLEDWLVYLFAHLTCNMQDKPCVHVCQLAKKEALAGKLSNLLFGVCGAG